ncbi:MucR family transcriptional regulator [Mesorhizobium sp. WSM2239]|uniref:MucR family transcriptional regulator n=2 Tax=unclassified Mesorhizobium TaxID=325217 RepID=A0AAU8DF39_9HYPH
MVNAGHGTTVPVEVEPQQPAVPVKKSVTPDYILCLEDGKPFKPLKRHLMTSSGMTPDEYRAKWNLPMVAPSYAAARSRPAKASGLGREAGIRAGASRRPRREGCVLPPSLD